MAGEYPGSPDPDESAETLRRLEAAGIGVFVDLTEAGELEPYAQLLRDARHERRAISDRGTAPAETYREILDLVDDAIGRNEGVYLHCLAGVGRTGTVVGCWLARHGLDDGNVLERIAVLRRSLPSSWQRSPETAAQVEIVRGWGLGD
jgi:protein-tyrosine phosphatase